MHPSPRRSWSVRLIQTLILIQEFFINGITGFTHLLQHRVSDVFRCHFQLTGDVVFYQLTEEGVIRVCQQVIEADTTTDKDFFDIWQRT